MTTFIQWIRSSHILYSNFTACQLDFPWPAHRCREYWHMCKRNRAACTRTSAGPKDPVRLHNHSVRFFGGFTQNFSCFLATACFVESIFIRMIMMLYLIWSVKTMSGIALHFVRPCWIHGLVGQRISSYTSLHLDSCPWLRGTSTPCFMSHGYCCFVKRAKFDTFTYLHDLELIYVSLSWATKCFLYVPSRKCWHCWYTPPGHGRQSCVELRLNIRKLRPGIFGGQMKATSSSGRLNPLRCTWLDAFHISTLLALLPLWISRLVLIFCLSTILDDTFCSLVTYIAYRPKSSSITFPLRPLQDLWCNGATPLDPHSNIFQNVFIIPCHIITPSSIIRV